MQQFLDYYGIIFPEYLDALEMMYSKHATDNYLFFDYEWFKNIHY